MTLFDKKDAALEKELYAAAENITDEDAALFDSIDDSAVELSAELDEKVAKIIDGGDGAERARRKKRRALRIVLRVAVAMIAVVIMTLPFVPRVSAQTREEWRIRCDEFEFFYIVRYLPDDFDGTAAHYDPPKTIEKVRHPYVKNKDAVASEDFASETKFDVLYELDGEEYMIFQQRTLTMESITAVTAQNGTKQTVDVGGYDGILFEYSHSDTKFLFWNDGEYAYYLQSKYLSSSEMINSATKMK